MSDHPADPPPPNSWLAPSWGRLALAAVVAGAGFFLPQEVPLEWYPLNEPGSDINYLEITCASDKDGSFEIYYNLTQGVNELHKIYVPISPTKQTYTYTFPLPDGPITELRLDPVGQGGTLTIRQMRIINRRNEEVVRLTRDMFRPQQQIAAITPLPGGWSITSKASASDPFGHLEFFAPIIPVGMNHRNLLRCLLSTGYLAGMLFILLMAVLTATWRPRGWRDFLVHAGFMAGLALLYAPVGNRGLIRNSWDYSRYTPPPVGDEIRLELDLVSSGPSPVQAFWDRGDGFNEADSVRTAYEAHAGLQTVRFPLPRTSLRNLRFDPRDNEGSVLIHGIRLVDAGRKTRLTLPLGSLVPQQEIATVEKIEEGLTIRTSPQARDPILHFTSPALQAINSVLTASPRQ